MRNLLLTFAVLGATASTGCITSRCFRDSDCAEGLVCREDLGTCTDPECSADHPDCARGKVCEQRFCVTGCADLSDCASNEQCIDRRCLRIGDECDCPLAHEFCGTDLNPRSPTAGEEVCVSESFEDGVAIFFGSVYCGHCTANFTALRTLEAKLEAEGLAPRLLWLQLKDAPAASSDVEARLAPEVTEPVIQDTEALGIWSAYATTWYHLVIVDSHGCLIRDFGPLDPTQIAGDVGDEILETWRDSMDDVCPPATLDGGDAGTDADADADADAEGDVRTEAAADAADRSDAVDAPDDAVPDETDADAPADAP